MPIVSIFRKISTKMAISKLNGRMGGVEDDREEKHVYQIILVVMIEHTHRLELDRS